MKKNPIISIIIPTYKRPHLLNLGLFSLSKQQTNHYIEFIVINDGIEDDTQQICNFYKNTIDIKYLFSGQRNLIKEQYRCPGFAYNVGIKQCNGDIIILTSPEIIHLTQNLNPIIKNLINNKNSISTMKYIYFDNQTEIVMNHHSVYAAKLPYFMALYKKHFIDIGGYDEDFTGYACDDDDLVNRLIKKGLVYVHHEGTVVHMYHGKFIDPKKAQKDPRWQHNYNLYSSRKNNIIRNKNRNWGELDES